MTAVGNFQRYVMNAIEDNKRRAQEETSIDTCPACDSRPVRIVMSMDYRGERYECLNRSCQYWSPSYATSVYEADEVPVASEPEPRSTPQVFYHGEPSDILGHQETPDAPRPVFLWTTRHNDFGDV